MLTKATHILRKYRQFAHNSPSISLVYPSQTTITPYSNKHRKSSAAAYSGRVTNAPLFPYNTIKRCSSSDTTDSDESHSTKQPNDYFPWSHTPHLPRRFEEKDDLSGMPNNFRARFVRRMIAGRELNLGFWDIVPLPFEREWEAELASNFCKAYLLALNELLRTVFKDSFYHERDLDENIISMCSVNSPDKKSNHKSDEDTSLGQNEYLTSMIDQNLLARYKLVDPDSVLVNLYIKPLSAKLEHIFAIPLLTRDVVNQKPHLKGGYLRIEKAFEESKSYDTVREMTHALADEVGRNNFKRTVVAEVSIRCLEIFQVKDAASGNLLRGTQDQDVEDEVVHVVRFEVVTDKKEDGEKGREVGNWKIIDWDDLLEGNSFH